MSTQNEGNDDDNKTDKPSGDFPPSVVNVVEDGQPTASFLLAGEDDRIVSNKPSSSSSSRVVVSEVSPTNYDDDDDEPIPENAYPPPEEFYRYTAPAVVAPAVAPLARDPVIPEEEPHQDEPEIAYDSGGEVIVKNNKPTTHTTLGTAAAVGELASKPSSQPPTRPPQSTPIRPSLKNPTQVRPAKSALKKTTTESPPAAAALASTDRPPRPKPAQPAQNNGSPAAAAAAPNEQETVCGQSNSKCIMIVVAILCLVAIPAIIIPAVLVSRNDDSSDDAPPRGIDTTAPTASPTLSPTPLATLSTSARPTVAATTMAPVPPTPSPTIAPLVNDVCTGAIEIFELNGSPLLGSTDMATVDLVSTCGDATTAGIGVWYVLNGIGENVTATTCGAGTTFDTQLSVYTGSCTSLVCVAGNDDHDTGACNLQSILSGVVSSVTWYAESGQTYYVLVHGFGSNAGNYEWTVFPNSPDRCEWARPMDFDTTLQGSTLAATTDSGVTGTRCDSVLNTAPGVWFSLVGNGARVTASTCSDFTDFDTKLTIYRGACGALECLAANDDSCVLKSSVSWTTLTDEVYYIYVHGFSAAQGVFELTLGPFIPDFCRDAIGPLPLDELTLGTTVGATFDNTGRCGLANNRGPGVWYFLEGPSTGPTTMIASTCTDTNFDTQLSLYAGSSCDSLVCVDGNDDANCGLGSVISWQSEPFERYYILVHGYGQSAGDFGLRVDAVDEPGAGGNDDCLNANGPLPLDGSVTVGSTAGATMDAVGICGNSVSTGPGVWYFLAGVGQPIVASTCTDTNTTFDTQISVFSGLCDSLVCVSGNDDFCGEQSSVQWDSEDGELYFILVHGYQNQTGDFELTVTAVAVSESSDSCSNLLEPLPTDGSVLFGTTEGATPDTLGVSCGDAVTTGAAGIFYNVIGTGFPLNASTCASASDFDTQLAVFTGTCDNLICIDGNDDFCGVHSSVQWNSTLGERYILFISGATAGNFSLSVEAEERSNDACLDAFGPLPTDGSFSTPGTTVTASFSGVGRCGSALNTAPGVWYFVEGTGLTLTASTCAGTTAFDTQISIFRGGCGSLVCVAGNDDFCFTQSSVTWFAEEGERYYIHVHGFGSNTGDFLLTLETPAEPSESNDICIDAFGPLPLNGSVTLGTTVDAEVDDVLECGGALNVDAVGVWYTVTGSGRQITVSTCTNSSALMAFNTQLSIFAGDCDNLLCIDGNDDVCGVQSQVDFVSESGQTYYIFVAGTNGTVGDFELTVSGVSGVVLPENDVCTDAIGPLPLDGSITLGSTALATADDLGCGNVTDAPGVFYFVNGTNKDLYASTCTNSSTSETHISVFSGSCGNLTCVGSSSDSCENRLEWSSIFGELYIILVQGSSNATTGEFGLTVGSVVDADDNDFCTGAIDLSSVNGSVVGTTSGATFDATGVCGEAENTAEGVWYTISGTGGLPRVFRASTCEQSDFNAQISVFRGSCSNLLCEDGIDGFCFSQTELQWTVYPDERYYILIHGAASTSGEFELIVEPVVAENDLCVDASGPLVLGGAVVVGSTMEATDAGVQACSPANITGPGLFYSVVGTGKALFATTCSNETEYATQVSVFSGSCDSLQCIGGSSDLCSSRVEWDSSPGLTYTILVHTLATTGEFGLLVGVVESEEEPDLCENALGPLAVDGSITEGSTSLDTAGYAGLDDCFGSVANATAPGVFYLVEGTDENYVASTCAGTNYDSRISIYVGACGSLVCVGSNDNFCGTQSEIEWFAETGQNYYILVHGTAGATGDFGLVVGVVNTDVCRGAEGPLPTDGSIITGSTALATADELEDCGEARHTGPSVWFYVEGSGGRMEVSTCTTENFDTQLTLLGGTCLEPVCIDGSDDSCGVQSRIEWQSEANEVYYIVVHGFGVSAGEFELSVTAFTEANDICEDAIGPLAIDGTITAGSTEIATFDNVPTCGDAVSTDSTAGLWYTVDGVGSTLRVSTCTFADFDTQISIFTGQCDALICVGGNNDACLTQSTIDFDTILGQRYYILVHGFGDDRGSFELSVTPASSFTCEEATGPLSVQASVTIGSTALAPPNGAVSCNGVDNSPGAWYFLDGINQAVTASTCFNSNYDTRITVFTGSCDSLTCVTAADACSLEWNTNQGQRYYILVHGAADATGYFELLLDASSGGLEGPNDFCEDALGPVPTDDSPISGSTINATVDNLPDCGTAITAPSVWYYAIGTGTNLVAATCGGAEWDTKLSVFSGSCSNLECLAGNDDFCGTRSSITWASDVGQVYYILVHGFSSSSGDFDLRVRETLIHDVCADAIGPLPSDGSVFEGTTVGATREEDVDFCVVSITAPGVWVSVLGTGGMLRADTCTGTASLDTKLSLFEGNCGSLVCIDGNDDSGAVCGGTSTRSAVTWQSVENRLYYILVHGFGTSTGTFGLRITQV